MDSILRSLPQYINYRNWMAHGRYWVLNDVNYIRKYNYPQIKMLLDNILINFGGKLKVKNFGLDDGR